MAKFIVTWEQFEKLARTTESDCGWWTDEANVYRVGGGIFASAVCAAIKRGDTLELVPVKRVSAP
jgi:hypothetical protein